MVDIKTLGRFCFFCFLLICAVQDIRERAIQERIYILFGVTGAVLSFIQSREIYSVILALIPGIALVLLALATREAIGMGDAIFYLVAALYMELRELLIMLLLSMLLCGITALVIITFYGLRSGKKEITIPYLAFLFPAGICVMLL